MRLQADPEANTAYLYLDEAAEVANRLVFTEEDDRPAWGINLDFDAGRHLVGVEFQRADRQLPERLLQTGEGLRMTYDPQVDAAYLYLTEIPKGGVEHTLDFGDEATRLAWGINLDFAHDERLVGIEFESADLAPPLVMTRCEKRTPEVAQVSCLY